MKRLDWMAFDFLPASGPGQELGKDKPELVDIRCQAGEGPEMRLGSRGTRR